MKKLLSIAVLISAAAFAQTDLPGPVRGLPDELHAAAGAVGAWNAAQAFWAGLTAPATASLVSGTYVSGITAVGSATQTCTLTAFNGGNTGGTATVALTGTNAIAGGTALVITAQGSGNTAPSTGATAGSGTATCSGTAVVTTIIDQVWAMPGADGSAGQCWGWTSAYTLGWASCGGGYWVLTGSNLAPSGNYNLLPTGSATFGNATNYWTQSFSVQDYAGTYYVVFGTFPFNIRGWIGWDTVNQQIAVVDPVGGSTFEFGNGTTATKANVSYTDLMPDVTNSRHFGGTSLRWEGFFDNINVNSCTGCGGTSYWVLTGSDLAPSGNYNLLPTGSATFGNTTNYWTQSFSVQDYAGTYYIVFGTFPLNIRGWIGWDTGNQQIAVVDPVGGSTFEFGNGTTATKANVSYNDLMPDVTNTRHFGGTSLRWEGFFDNINVNSCTGCPGSSGTVTSVATTSPITGGTFTTSGTIGCSTCLVTGGGQSIGGTDTWNATQKNQEIDPILTNTYNLGSTGAFWNEAFINEVVTSEVSIGTVFSSVLLTQSGGTLQVTIAPSTQVATFNNVSSTLFSNWLPSSTSAFNLGSPSLFWSNAYVNTVNAGTAVIAPIYDVTGGFFGQDLTGGLTVTTSGGTCKIFFKGGIIYAVVGSPSTGAACI